MLGAIYIGLSGMDAYSRGLQTISNNVANLNTLGFKSTAVSFSDVFNYGGGGLSFSRGTELDNAGNGVRFGDPRIDFGQGDLRQSDGDLDLAIQGSGFLTLLKDDKTYYGRTGQFSIDKEGYISQNGTGYRLAVLNDAKQPVALNIDAKRLNPAVATTKISFVDNLTSDLGTSTPGNPVTATVSNIAVYDSNGTAYSWTVKFTRGMTSGNSTEWKVDVTDQKGAALGSGTISFVAGNIVQSSSTVTINKEIAGAANLKVTLDFSGTRSNSGGATSTVRTGSVDGNGLGKLTTTTIENGKIKLTYSNEKTELLGSVAIADFRDPQQLERIGQGLFENRGSGEIRFLASGEDGGGKLIGRQVEASNVDLSQEFGDLILIQRGFQASSQVVSVANDMIQQLFGIRGQG